jgi:signal transduction histidine kinase/CheY-like chemotaxis protein
MIFLLLGNTVYANEIPNFNLNDPMPLSELSSLHWTDDSLTATPSLAKVKMLTGELNTGLFTVPLKKAHHWFAFTLSNPTDRAISPSIFVRQAYPNQVNLHYQQQGQWISLYNGTDVAIKQRQVTKLPPVFNVSIDAGQSQTFYLEMHSKIKLLQFEINIGEAENSSTLGDLHITLVQMFIGASLMISLINILMYLSFKQRVYIYYSAYILSFIAVTFVVNSFDLYFNWSMEDRSALFLTYHSMIIFISLFISEVLNTKSEMPKIDFILKAARWLAFTMALVTVVDGNYFSYTIVAFLPISAFFLAILIYASVAGKSSAKLLAIGNALFLTGIICASLVNLDIISANVVTEHGALIGASAEMVLFSIALFRRVINLNSEVNLANTRLAKIAQDSQALLEKTVAQRTLELSQAKVSAERANEARGRFLTTINHEVRTPLNGILGMIEVLQRYPLPSDAKDHLVTLNVASQQLAHLVNNVLDFSKIDQGMLQLHTTKFDLWALIEQLKNSFEHQALAKSIAWKVSVDPKVAQYWRGDEHRIQQILLNLVSNAVKFTAQGGVSLKVALDSTDTSISPKSHTKGLLFSVSDTGTGISATELEPVFDAYYQVNQRSQKHTTGTGLGLPISQQLAHAMGGHIRVTSMLNQGSQFELRLILNEATPNNEQVRLPGSDPSRLPDISHNCILIVDDSDINRKVAQAYLQPTEAHLTLCGNGQQALDYFQAHEVDIVLMDLQMPELDGLEACRQMRLMEQRLQRPRSLIILHTADTRPELIATASAAGVDYCLFKPYSQAQLMHAMELSLTIGISNSGSGSGSGSGSNTSMRLENDSSLDGLKVSFFQQTKIALQQCAQYIESHQINDMPALLHQLIGSTSLFGAHQLHATLTQMNDMVRPVEDCDREVNEVDDLVLSQLILLAQQQLKSYQADG